MRNFSLFGLLVTASFHLSTFGKEIALTFDDAPRSVGLVFENGIARAQRFVRDLAKAKVERVAFFVNTSGLDDEGWKRLSIFTAEGHLLGNHTHSHLSINATPVDEFIADFEKADQILNQSVNFKRWFRFPYLWEGSTIDTRDLVRAKLREMDYENAYITIDNYDWHMDWLVQRALHNGEKVDFVKLREVYIEVLLACVDFYDELAKKALGRSPKHVFLLHETDLNALFIGDLVLALQNAGWSIITPEDAYSDPIAKYQTSNVFRFNPGRIGEIAKDFGVGGALSHESCDEEYLENLFLARKVFVPRGTPD